MQTKKNIQLEADSFLIYQPRYVDEKKTRIKAIVRLPNGQIMEMEANRADTKSTLIRDIFSQYSAEEIELFSAREQQVVAQKVRIETQAAEDRRLEEEREVTFQAKTKALEIPEVKDCPDPRVARKIRKARSAFEVAGWLAVAFLKSLDEK